MNKSATLIFDFVKIKSERIIISVHIIGILFASVNGKCSFIFWVVFPCIVFTKYVYGVVPNGVNSPVNKQIIIIKISHLTLSFLFNFIL